MSRERLNEPEMLRGTRHVRLGYAVPVAVLAVLSAFGLLLNGCSEGGAAEGGARPDLVEIDIRQLFGEPERAPVQFPHDLHTEAMRRDREDCTLCHREQEDGYLSPKYMRLEDLSGDELMALYHDKCIACHTEKTGAGEKAGPLSCGDCHRRKPIYVSSVQPFGFDKSLHYRHIKAHNEKCEKCHHLYDEEAEKLIYEKGKEEPCRDCHRVQTEENRSSFKLAAHRGCIGCHRKTAEQGPDARTGPRECGGCHDLGRQLQIEVVEKPPRLKRGQPDFVLLSAPEAELNSSKLATVPFSHVGHEEFNKTCRVCHHETLKPCKECHTLKGSDESKGVMLQHAMHAMSSDHSCVGCHETKKSVHECAGCHDLMEKGRLSEHACGICHAGPSPLNLEAERSRYTSLEDFRPDSSAVRLTFTATEIPDSVEISVLSKEYKPAVMPHRKIVDKLREDIRNSKIASYFHGHENIVCQGCHHHGSIGERPALCENCHGRPFDESDIYKPGLYGAYHRQCLGCHKSMDMKKPSDCAGCHAKKENVAER